MAPAAVVVAATEGEDTGPRVTPPAGPAGALLAAALALPGVMPASALAQTAPDQSLFALKYVDYRDWQPGGDRIHVHSPSLYLLKPLSDSLAAEGSLVYDSISGASPLYHNTLSGASGKGGVTDYRTAGNVKLTKYFDGAAVGVGAAISSERDYLSRALSLDVRVSSDDRNRTYAFGVGGASDDINSTNGIAEGKHRRTVDLLLGVTQALSPEAIVQSNLTWSVGHGYYSDPYKTLDTRPDGRRILAWLTRYNQHLPIRRDAVAVLSLRARFVRQRFTHGRGGLASAAGGRLVDKTRIALLHAGCGGFLFRPTVPAGIFVWRAVYGGYTAVGVRRAEPGGHCRQAAARRLASRCQSRVLPAALGLAARRGQPRARAAVGALDPDGRQQDVLKRRDSTVAAGPRA